MWINAILKSGGLATKLGTEHNQSFQNAIDVLRKTNLFPKGFDHENYSNNKTILLAYIICNEFYQNFGHEITKEMGNKLNSLIALIAQQPNAKFLPDDEEAMLPYKERYFRTLGFYMEDLMPPPTSKEVLMNTQKLEKQIQAITVLRDKFAEADEIAALVKDSEFETCTIGFGLLVDALNHVNSRAAELCKEAGIKQKSEAVIAKY